MNPPEKKRRRPASSNSRAAKHNKERHCEERKRYVLRAKSDFNSDCFIRQPQGCCHLQSPLSVGRALDCFVTITADLHHPTGDEHGAVWVISSRRVLGVIA